MAQLVSKAKEIIMHCQVRSSVENSETLNNFDIKNRKYQFDKHLATWPY